MGRADFFANGDWNFTCDFCGAKNKNSNAMKTWDNFYVCKHHKEVRNPQDFLRGVKDDQTTPWNRPFRPPLCDTTSFPFIDFCTLQMRNAMAGYACPGCATPSFINFAFVPSLEQYRGWAIQDTFGCAILDTNGQMIFPPNTPSATNPLPPTGAQYRLDIDFILDFSTLS